jgi:PAS domain-containing protein
VVFLFDGPRIVDCSAAARDMTGLAPGPIDTRDALIDFLRPRFPEIGSLFRNLESRDQIHVFSRDQTEIAAASRIGDRIRLIVVPVEDPDDMIQMDRPTMSALQDELKTLRATTEHVPVLIWRQAGDGTIQWVNRAYLETCRARAPDWTPGTWPLPRLFDLPDHAADPGEGAPLRVSLGTAEAGDQSWFHLNVTELDSDDRLIVAMDVNSVVEAETSLRNVVQALSKTFADLPIGLAVFTRDRRLTLFNPALGDLTTIPPEKLINRPTIFDFFDQLRALQIMPEPKNYTTWREQIAQLEASVADGTYEETWHLPYGRTFRVTGRPQVGGAVAILFEDISAEIGVTRHLRSELETSQGVLDCFDQAVAVFSASGVLTTSNAAYDTLWSRHSRDGLDDLDVAAAINGWSSATAPTPLWEDIRRYVLAADRRGPLQASAQLLDGRGLSCTCRQIVGGCTLVTFSLQTAGAESLRPSLSEGVIETPLRRAGITG